MLQKIKFYSVLLCVLGALTIVASCKKKKDDPAPAATSFSYTDSQYQKKWDVSNTNRTSGTGTTLIGVEFTSGLYLLYFSDNTVSTGTYKTSGTNVLLLNGYGTLTINALTDTQFGFSLAVNNSTQTFTSAVAKVVITESSNTTILCKTWKITSYTISGYGTVNPAEYYVVFNKYGTYLTNETDAGVTKIGTNTWMWSDTAEDSFCYGQWDGSNITDCTGLGTASMTFSSDNKTMTMTAETGGFTVVYVLAAQ